MACTEQLLESQSSPGPWRASCRPATGGPEAKSWQYGPHPARSDASLSLPGPQTLLSVSGPGSVTSNNGCCSWPVARLPWATPGASIDRHLHGSVCLWFQVAVHAGLPRGAESSRSMPVLVQLLLSLSWRPERARHPRGQPGSHSGAEPGLGPGLGVQLRAGAPPRGCQGAVCASLPPLWAVPLSGGPEKVEPSAVQPHS